MGMDGGRHLQHSHLLQGLQPDTVYHYRWGLAAGDGTVYGSKAYTFRTWPKRALMCTHPEFPISAHRGLVRWDEGNVLRVSTKSQFRSKSPQGLGLSSAPEQPLSGPTGWPNGRGECLVSGLANYGWSSHRRRYR